MKEEATGTDEIDWSSLIKSEDWLVVWLGFAILLLVAFGIITNVPNPNISYGM